MHPVRVFTNCERTTTILVLCTYVYKPSLWVYSRGHRRVLGVHARHAEFSVEKDRERGEKDGGDRWGQIIRQWQRFTLLSFKCVLYANYTACCTLYHSVVYYLKWATAASSCIYGQLVAINIAVLTLVVSSFPESRVENVEIIGYNYIKPPSSTELNAIKLVGNNAKQCSSI